MVINATNVAFFAVCLRRLLLSVEVMDIKIGMVDKGFINVKKDVNTNKPNV